ncbi:12294_t:CDS:1, partial [Funneliformis caledonium]
MAKFLTGYDSELQLSTQGSTSMNLLPSRCAHQMSDFVICTIMKLRNIAENPYFFFKIELLE